MNRFQLSQGNRATMKRQFIYTVYEETSKVPGIPGVHLINFRRLKGRIDLVVTE